MDAYILTSLHTYAYNRSVKIKHTVENVMYGCIHAYMHTSLHTYAYNRYVKTKHIVGNVMYGPSGVHCMKCARLSLPFPPTLDA
jgi:hypothetical protein